MNYAHNSETRDGYRAWLVLIVLLITLWLIFLGPLAMGVVLWSWWIEGQLRLFLANARVFFFSLSWSIVIICLVPALARRGVSLPWFWLMAIPSSPVLAFLWRGFVTFLKLLKPKSLEESVKTWQEGHKEQNVRLAQQASQEPEPLALPRKLRMGRYLKGDIYTGHSGLHISKNWLWLDEQLLDQHVFLLGATGAGKSETLKRMIYEVLVSTERNIYFVDGKGDERLANEVRSLAYHFGRGESPVFRLGFGRNGAIYNGFRGHPTDVYNRLCALIGVRETEGNATYYADINRDILQLICYAPQGAPRNFEEVRTRINKGWLTQAYQGNALELTTIEALQENDIQGLARRLRPLAREFAQCVGDDGFALEDVRSAVFSIRTQSVGDTANRFLGFLTEDIKDFIGKRQTHPGLLVIDEFGQFDNESIISLLSLARSSKLGVVLATQDTANLRDPRVERLVLANTRTKILMATDFPEEVAKLAGTAYKVESSIQHQDGQPTGMGSSRVQHSFRVDMNEVAGLSPGEAFVIRQRLASKMLVRPIGTISLIAEQPERKRKTTQSIQEKETTASGPEAKKSQPRQRRTL